MKKHAFVLTTNEERFDALHSLLADNGYVHNQSWEDLENDLKKFESLEVKWPDSIRGFVYPLNLPVNSINQVKEILLDGHEDLNALPIFYIIEKDLNISMCAEEVFGCIKYTVESLDGNAANLPVVYLFDELSEPVPLDANTKYVHISHKFEKTEFEIEKFIEKISNPEKANNWFRMNF